MEQFPSASLHLFYFASGTSSHSALIKQNTLKIFEQDHEAVIQKATQTVTNGVLNGFWYHIEGRDSCSTCPKELPPVTTGYKESKQKLSYTPHSQYPYVAPMEIKGFSCWLLQAFTVLTQEKLGKAMLRLGFCAALFLLPHLRLLAPSGTPAAGQQHGPGADTAAAITRVKEKASHLFSAGSYRSSSHHRRLPAARTWRRVHHRCETISLSALTRRRNLSSLQHARGSLGFVWVWKISKHTPFSFSFKPATGLGSKLTFLKLFLSPFSVVFVGG